MKVLGILVVFLITGWSAAAGESIYGHLWGGSATSLNGRSPEQRNNAARAALDLHGTILPAGALFSFNDLVGARDTLKGYRAAPIITVSGMVEDTPGGGICQVATTIYNAALAAGLDIVERHPHSRRVGYVALGRDATILTWRKDLKLRNPHQVPLQLRVAVSGRQVTASFWAVAHKPFRVLVTSEQSQVAPEASVAEAARSGHVVQAGAPGWAVRTRRTIISGGQVTEQLLSEDFYPPPSTIVGGGAP